MNRYAPLLVALAATWGASYLFIKVGVDGGFSPAALMAARTLIAAVTLTAYLGATTGWRKMLVDLRAAWRPALVLGALNAAIPFWFVAWGETHIESGVAAIAQATVPLCSLLIGLPFLPHERIGPARIGGVVLGLAGVAVLAGIHPHGGWPAVAGTLAIVVASVSYASAGVYGQLRSPAQATARRLREMTVSIRRARVDDAAFLVSLTTHDDVDPFLAAGRDRSPEAMAADIARSESTPDEFGIFVIEAAGESVGTMRFELANRRSRIADLSQLAVHPAARGRGVADEAARLFQRHLIDDLGFHRLQLEVYAFNERALAHVERVGYTREGIRRKAYRSEDGWIDGIMFGLVAED